MQYAGDIAATFLQVLTAPSEERTDPSNVRGAVVPIGTFVATLRQVVPEAEALVTHGDRQLPIARDLDDSRLEARLGPPPRTSLAVGIGETCRRFAALREQGRLSPADLG